MNERQSATQRSTGSLRKAYDGLMLFLSFYVLLQLSVEVILTLPEHVNTLLYWVDFGICILFLVDWIVFFAAAEDKKKFVKERWIDLPASIPFAQVLRPLRVLRVVRLVRALRLVRGLKAVFPILRALTANPARSALFVYATLTTLVYF